MSFYPNQVPSSGRVNYKAFVFVASHSKLLLEDRTEANGLSTATVCQQLNAKRVAAGFYSLAQSGGESTHTFKIVMVEVAVVVKVVCAFECHRIED